MRISRLYMPAATLAGALALAACGGGSDSPGTVMLTPQKACEDGGGTWDGDANMCTRTPVSTPTQLSITAEADTAKSAADAAFKKAADASDGGNKMPKTGFAAVQGVSADATANAMAILDAETEINAALADARAALKKAEALPATAVGKVRLVESLEGDIKTIEANQKTVMALAKEIRGKSRTKPHDAAHWGTEAAKGLDGALLNSNGNIKSISARMNTEIADASGVLFHGSTRPDGARNFNNVFVKGEKLGDTGGAVALPKAEAGISVSTEVSLENGTTDLEGTFTCVSESGCAAVAVGGEIGDGWKFIIAAADQNKWYVKDGGTYGPVNYLEWGMWFDASDGVKAWASRGAGSAALVATDRGVIGANAALDETATYTGDAHGLSTFRASTAGEDAKAVRSGHFMADVELKATFGDAPMLEGMIDNFRGDAVNAGWKVEIEKGTLSADGMGDNLPAVKDGGRFSHQSYGEADRRPDGIVGEFGKDFSDGAVAGVYHATQ